ncbi:MAG: hypothetical protein QGI16_06115 [Candidatus Marinimicrobia bacterium]|jgi:hypothetical protein|nr:hypothetical protein [Candidatus Neomarinimicrobiota bacterium]
MKKELKQTIALISVSAVVALAITLGLYSRASSKITEVKSKQIKTLTKSTSAPENRIDLTSAEDAITLSTTAEISDQNVANAEEPKTEVETSISTEVAVPEYNGQGSVGYTFSEAFRDARANLGSGNIFIWNGMEYTTTLASELLAEEKVVLAAADSASEESVEELNMPEEPADRPEVSIPVREEILLSTSGGANSSSSSAGRK